MRTPTKNQDLVDALRSCLISPNVADTNLEPANLVDTTNRMASGLFAIAKALGRIADAMERSQGSSDESK